MILTTRKSNLSLETFFILMLALCIIKQSPAKTLVTFQRGQGSQIGGSSFYQAFDQFENIIGKISSNSHLKRNFCEDLNAICFGADCKTCYCRDNVPFISYNIGCRNDYFNGKYLWLVLVITCFWGWFAKNQLEF